MRIFYVALLVLCASCSLSAQVHDRLADTIDTGRTIIAKLDHATQGDPPPNFASSIIVDIHQEAAKFIALADDVSTTLRRGDAPEGTAMFSLYCQFIDLYNRYELFTTIETRPLALDKVLSVAMATEYTGTKAVFEAATYLQISTMEDQLKSCLASKRR